MVLTPVGTEKVPGRITHVKIGKDSSNGVDINKGIKFFDYHRAHDAHTAFNASAKTESSIFQPHSNFEWRLEFISDCRVAFFGTDISATAGNQFALDDNGDSTKIDYFRVIMPITDSNGNPKTRTYVIMNGYALRNGAAIGDDED